MGIDTPKVSIITLLGDRDVFIPLVKYCVKHQTYPSSHLEWIILDDGITDKSKEFDLEIATYVKLFKKFNTVAALLDPPPKPEPTLILLFIFNEILLLIPYSFLTRLVIL